MFYSGIGSTPPLIPNEYTLDGCGTESIIPASDIEVGIITLCGLTYFINDIFDSQADFVAFLNDVFLPAFGLLDSFYIDENRLVYVTTSDCSGTNCIEILIGGGLLTDGGDPIKTDGGFQLEVD